METTKRKTKDFAIFCNQMIGEWKRAENVEQLIEKMPKRHRKFWSSIQFKDEDNNTITVTREFLEDGMSIEECIDDWKKHAGEESLTEGIHAIKRNGDLVTVR